MSKVQKLRSLLKQRLPADEEEIFELFERTTAEYEEELCGLKEENERQRKLLDALSVPEVRSQKTGVQQLLVKQEVYPEQQEWTCSLGQTDNKFHHIKKEEEELWITKEREHLQVLEVDTTKCANDVKHQSSHCQESQTEETGEVEPPSSSSTEQMKTKSNGKDWGGSELVSRIEEESYLQTHIDIISHSSEPENEARDIDWDETREPESCLYSLKNETITVCDRSGNGGVELFSHKHGQRIGHKGTVIRNMESHTREKAFSCSQCGKTFNRNYNLKAHVRIHTGEKPFRCSECGKAFSIKGHLKTHMLSHTGEKPFSCSECGKAFRRNHHLKTHIIFHTGEKPFSCSECGKTFSQNCDLKTHMIIHTGQKPFICPECGKTFNLKGSLKRHMICHIGKKPFSCSECGQIFYLKGKLKRHMISHT